MSDDEVSEIRQNILKLVASTARTAATLEAVRSDVSELKENVQEISQWRGAFRVMIWIATAVSGLVAALATGWYWHK